MWQTNWQWKCVKAKARNFQFKQEERPEILAKKSWNNAKPLERKIVPASATSGIILSTLVYYRFCVEDWNLWLLFIFIGNTQRTRWWPIKGDLKSARMLENTLSE